MLTTENSEAPTTRRSLASFLMVVTLQPAMVPDVTDRSGVLHASSPRSPPDITSAAASPGEYYWILTLACLEQDAGLTQKFRCNAVVPESRHGQGRCASHSSLTFAPMSMSFFDGATMLNKTVCKCKQDDGARWSRFNLVRILSDYQCKHDIVGWTKKEWWTNGLGDVCSSFFCCCKDNKMQ